METDAVLEHLKTLDRAQVTIGEIVQYIRDNTPPPQHTGSVVIIARYLKWAFDVGIKDALGIADWNQSYWNLTIDEAEKAVQKI